MVTQGGARRVLLGLALVLGGLAGCTTPPSASQSEAASPTDVRPVGWSEASHGADATPDYVKVFPADKVQELTITLTPRAWATMQADLCTLIGEPSMPSRSGMPPVSFSPLPGPTAEPCPPGATRDPAKAEDKPAWVPGTIGFDGRTWPDVGVRYKGVSSLANWKMGSLKLPFKFSFDQYEDDVPAVADQRFYGFKELSLANDYSDPTHLRDRITYDVLGAAGLPSLHAATYRVLLDHGTGPLDLGLYTMVELADDTGVPAVFGSNDGNLYEGDGAGATLASSDLTVLKSGFDKENNKKADDWGDLQSLANLLQAEQRTTDPKKWRAALEQEFDVDGFLQWLGIAGIIGDIDNYGTPGVAHNFYLYDNPKTGQLTWISWDHNLAYRVAWADKQNIDKSEVGADSPLIRSLLDDPVYAKRYAAFVRENASTVLDAAALEARIRAAAAVVGPASGEPGYDSAIEDLVSYVKARPAVVEQFLSNQK